MAAEVVFLCLVVFLASVSEVGFRVGSHFRGKLSDGAKSYIGTIQGATLTLLSLMLGFVVSMAESRFDLRKYNALNEANAIGTAFLRAGLYSQSDRAKLEDLFRRYVDTRLEFYAESFDEKNEENLQQRTSNLQNDLWSTGALLAKKDPQSIPAGLFLHAMNDVIDFSERQSIAFHNYLPASIIGLLFFVSLIALGVVGYLRGLNMERHFWLSSLLTLLFSMTLFVILDLERPRRGLIRVNYESMLRLRNTVQKGNPPTLNGY